MGLAGETVKAVDSLKEMRRQLVAEIAAVDAAMSEASRMLSESPQRVVAERVSGNLRGEISEVLGGSPRTGLSLDEIVIALIQTGTMFPKHTSEADWVDLVFNAVSSMIVAGEVVSAGKTLVRYKPAHS